MYPYPRRRMSPESFRFTVTPLALLSEDLRSFSVCYCWCYHPEWPCRQISRKSFLNLLCLHHLLSFFFLIPKEPSTKQAGTYQSGTLNIFYLQIMGELGKRPQRKLPDGLQTRSFGPSVQRQRPHSCCQGWWCRQPLTGLQRATWRLEMCDCSQGPNLFRGGGIQSGSFSSSRTETGLFPRGLL